MNSWTINCALTSSLLLAAAQPALGQQGASPELSLDSLLNIKVSAASKYSQLAAEAPASVSIITSLDIRQHGYRNLQHVLETVPGFYVSNDRNYTYLGTRGFSRPTDYNNRILLLVDGHTLNERVWGSAPIGSELPVSFDAIERIEIVRGPGSALYGTSAMFAVINLVTKSGAELDGIVVSARGGTGEAREATIAAGQSLGAWGTLAVSGVVNRADGGALYFPEYDAAETNFGVTAGTDWEEGYGMLASLVSKNFAVRGGARSRSKGVPTGAYGSLFGDPRASTRDATFWGEVSGQMAMVPNAQLSGRVYGDAYRYRGAYPADSGPAYTDGGGHSDLGGEVMFVWDAISSNRLTLGAEAMRAFHANYWERSADGVLISDNAPHAIASLYAQNELQLFRGLTFVAGVRGDRQSRIPAAYSPRMALVMLPDARSTLKLLYGEAFRAPTPSEAYLTTSLYTRNPLLKPERIRTFELQAQRRLAEGLLFSISLYDYRLRNLIDQVAMDTTGSLQFANVAASHGRGVEIEADLTRGPFTTRAWLALQRAHGVTSSVPLTNSPAQTGSITTTARAGSGLYSTASIRFESGRGTLAGASTPSFARTDFSVGFAPTASRNPLLNTTTFSLRVGNALNARYYAPGGLEHLQDRIVQEARSVSVRVGRSF